MNRSERIAQQLGMSHGAAAGKLKKNILFHLLSRLEENICFKCQQHIECYNDLSIEHIKPWEGRCADLFWDMENISFSHLKCNRQHVYRGGTHRRIKAPDGMAWCSKHKEFLPKENFSKGNDRWNGLRHVCKNCEKEYKDFIRYPERFAEVAQG